MIRTFINQFTITTYPCGNIWETIVCDKYGRQVRACTDFSMESAKFTHNRFTSMQKAEIK